MKHPSPYGSHNKSDRSNDSDFENETKTTGRVCRKWDCVIRDASRRPITVHRWHKPLHRLPVHNKHVRSKPNSLSQNTIFLTPQCGPETVTLMNFANLMHIHLDTKPISALRVFNIHPQLSRVLPSFLPRAVLALTHKNCSVTTLQVFEYWALDKLQRRVFYHTKPSHTHTYSTLFFLLGPRTFYKQYPFCLLSSFSYRFSELKNFSVSPHRKDFHRKHAQLVQKETDTQTYWYKIWANIWNNANTIQQNMSFCGSKTCTSDFPNESSYAHTTLDPKTSTEVSPSPGSDSAVSSSRRGQISTKNVSTITNLDLKGILSLLQKGGIYKRASRCRAHVDWKCYFNNETPNVDVAAKPFWCRSYNERNARCCRSVVGDTEHCRIIQVLGAFNNKITEG